MRGKCYARLLVGRGLAAPSSPKKAFDYRSLASFVHERRVQLLPTADMLARAAPLAHLCSHVRQWGTDDPLGPESFREKGSRGRSIDGGPIAAHHDCRNRGNSPAASRGPSNADGRNSSLGPRTRQSP